jgi:vacuolar-type H+-ATPase subunit I/STV1
MKDPDREEIRIDWLVPPWGAKVPTPVDHYVAPTMRNEAADGRLARANELKAEQAEKLDPARLAIVERLYEAHMANIAQQSEARLTRQALDAPLPDNVDLAAVAARAREREDVDRYLAVLVERSARSGQALSDAISEVRSDLWTASESEGGVVQRLRSERRRVAETIAELEEQAGQIELLIMGVTSRLNAWNWPADKPAEAPSQSEPAKRKRLFGGS